MIASLLEISEKSNKEVEFDFPSFESKHLQTVCDQLGLSAQVVQSLRPCTPVQNGMLALFTHSHGDMYFNKMAVKSEVPLERVRLKEAWSKVAAQHEMLRTGFVQLRDQQYPFAMITYREAQGIPWHETSELPSNGSIQGKQVLESLYRPPWQVTVDSGEQIDVVHFAALHAIYDAQSLETIFSDVMAAYEGTALDKPPAISATLGPILIESQWQIEKGQEFWQGLASGFRSSKFPDLHPIRTGRRDLLEISFCCSRPLRTLEDRCRKLGVTLQAAGQASWARLLAAYTGEQSVVFGTVLSGRSLSAAAQEAVFPCLVTIPSPSCVEGTNRELLDRTLTSNSSLIKNQFAPLAQIQRWLGSDEPLFDTLFVYQKFSSKTKRHRNWHVTDEAVKIDVCYFFTSSTHLTRSDLVPEEQAMTLLRQYDKLLEQTIFSPESDSTDYLCLGDDLLSITPAKEQRLPSPLVLLHQFVEENAQKIPDKAALEFATGATADSLRKKTWSYSEFNEDGNRIAHFLQDKGVVPGGMIAICFDKCPEASIAILGILKVGCAFLAIDPGAPISRKQFILEDSGTKILLCNQARKTELEGLAGIDVQVLDEPGLYEGLSSAAPVLSREIQPSDTCYCLYTSGTTGTPKGCEITHDNAVQAMLAFQRLFSPHWDENSRWLQFASFHFDVSVLEQYWSWSVGICVTSCPRDLLFEDLPGTIQKLQITHIDLTPSLARLVHPDEVPSLCRGVFITGGEALKQEILDVWGKYGVIYNGYGPTEVTIGCTMLPRMHVNDKPSNIGPQFDNVGSYVFRPGTTTPVVRGGLGELCVSGPLVGKGYLNRAKLTQERFQDLLEYGDRIYRTGDLVRILHDGSFQFLGRIDDQVKLRGQRLEIGEINQVIKQATPELNEVATLVIKHPKQSKDQLVSFITRFDTDGSSRNVEIRADENCSVLLSTIKAACQTHLPGYMVPTHIIPMTRFPLSANNKAEMKVLRSFYQELSLENLQNLTSMTVDRSRKSEDEEKIISTLAKFIGSTEGAISSGSSIFELGLDSISVISFSRSLREAGFSQAQPSLIMKHPNVAGMALALKTTTSPSVALENFHKNARQSIEAFAHKHSHSVMESIGVSDGDVEQIAPCTPLQEGIIYHFLSSTIPLYCSSFTFELDSGIDFDKLKVAWSQAQDQIQILRTRFSPSSDGYAQIVLKKDVLPWFQETVNSEEEIEISHKMRVEKWISCLGDLSAQLWEVGVVSSPEKSVMNLKIFHALYDGNSLALLLELVALIYNDSPRALERPPGFFDVLHLGPLCKDPSEQAFWKKHLANLHNQVLPKAEDESNGPILENIRIDSTEHLTSLKKALNVTEQAVLHACWLLTFYRHYSFVPSHGVIASGRTIDVPGIANVVGPLFNTIPSNVQLGDLKTWSDVARRCHEYYVETIPFQYTALRDISKWLGKNPDERLFESLFVFQRENSRTDSATDGLWHPSASEAQHEYPLAFEIVRNGDEYLTATLAAKGHVLSLKTAQQTLATFKQILSDFAEDPEQQLLHIDGCKKEHEARPNEEAIEKPKQSLDPSGDDDESAFQWSSQACAIRDVIATLAGVDAQSIEEDTSIFEIGLDSIDAIKLSSRLSKLSIKLPVSAIMRYRSVKGMAGQLTETTYEEENGTYPLLVQMERTLKMFLEREGLVPQGASRVLPATPIQEAMIAEMSASEYQHYYNHDILKIEPHVDATKLQEAWRAVVRANPILRTSFAEVWDPEISASYAQIVHSEDTFDFQKVQLDGETMDSIMEAQRARAFSELAGKPLFTVTSAVDGEDRYLVLSISHALYDGWSINLLHEDVARSYAGEGCARPLSDAILEQILASSGDRALKFWRATLTNCTPMTFPSGPDSTESSRVVHRAERTLSIPFEKAELFCKRNSITMQALLVSCWSLVLATYVKKLDVVFGLVLSGRNVTGSEDMMFPTMNTAAMRVILHGTRLELVKYVQETLLEMSEYQHFPLRRAMSDTRSQQLFDTLFIYQKRPSENGTPEMALYKSIGGASDVEYPVCAEIEGVGADLVARVACSGQVLGATGTLLLLEHIGKVLTFIVDEPSQNTVGFEGDKVNVCDTLFSVDSSSQAIQTDTTEEAASQRSWTSLESKICNVLAVVSGVPADSIERQANIFQLGLDSISAIKVVALLKKQSIRLAVSDLLRAGTIEKMAMAANKHHTELTSTEVASYLEKSLEGIEVNSLLQSYGIGFDQVEIVLPATGGQTYFLAMHTMNPSIFYPAFQYSASQLNQDILDGAWVRLAELTPILRTVFLPTGQEHHLPYIQAVLKHVRNPVVWHRNIDELCTLNYKQRFGALPATLHACQTSEGTALALQIHHALYDAISLPSMVERLALLCRPIPTESRSELHDMSRLVAFYQFHSPVDVRRQFWQNYLGQISIDSVNDKCQSGFDAIQQHYRQGLVSNMSCVEIAAQKQGLSVQSIFLAVYARVHAQTLAAVGADSKEISRQLVVGLYLANRSHDFEGLSDLMAPTVNIVPLRLGDKISHDPDSLFVAAQKIQDDINEISMIQHSSVSLVEIAKWTGVRISTCVNFLRLPEKESTHAADATGRVEFKPLSRDKLSSLQVSTLDQHDQSPTNGDSAASLSPAPTVHVGSTAAIQDVFMPTIDVEAAIRDGRLDFGIFASEARLDYATAEQMIEKVRQEMTTMVEFSEIV
ncbi:AMP-dependent synthetase/ligase [Penicillium sp. IBT 18751x]|nr:AMP-dependent synthetase/ligase [Penicillium sp. IBT 18751x]